MSDPADDLPRLPPYRETDAPFVYFDIAPTYGILNGAVQIELAARLELLQGPQEAATAGSHDSTPFASGKN